MSSVASFEYLRETLQSSRCRLVPEGEGYIRLFINWLTLAINSVDVCGLDTRHEKDNDRFLLACDTFVFRVIQATCLQALSSIRGFKKMPIVGTLNCV